MDVEEFGNVVVSCVRVFFAERSTDGRRLLLDQGAFICDGLLGLGMSSLDGCRTRFY